MDIAERLFPTQSGAADGEKPNNLTLPPPAHGAWRIEMRYHPILHRGHAYLALIDPEGKTQSELHGMAQSRNTDEITPIGTDGAKLVVPFEYRMPREQTQKIGDVAVGTYDEIVRGKWARGLRAGDQINKGNFDYKSHDPSYEFGTDGGQIQNSDAATYTFGKAMDLDLTSTIQDAGMGRKFPGWGRDLVDPDYKRYIAPPQFAVSDTP